MLMWRLLISHNCWLKLPGDAFQGLLTRGRVKLILCRNSGAFDDALLALKGVAGSGDPVYPRAMSLKAAALYQMGDYEHALLNYHRADR